MQTTGISFFDLELYFIFSIDLSSLIDRRYEDVLNSLRGKRSWLLNIRDMFYTSKHPMLFKNPECDTSQYIKSARLEKFTISELFLQENSPLRFNIGKPIRIGGFIISECSVRFHQDGVLTVRFHLKQIRKHAKFDFFDVDGFVSTMQPIRRKIEQKAVEMICAFCEDWNRVSNEVVLEIASKSTLKNSLHKYEIILFDYSTSSGHKIPIKNMYNKDKLDLLRQLVGFARMSRPFAWKSYSFKFMSEFVRNDVGNREDELWLVYYERLVRYIPQRKDQSVVLWLEDALLGIEILLAKKAVLEYVTSWSRAELLLLRQNVQFLVDKKFMLQKAISEANKLIANLYCLLSTVLDPLSLERNITHEFYLTLIRSVVKHLRIDRLTETAKSTFGDLNQTSQLIKSLGDTVANLRLQQQMKKLTIIALLFTLAAIVIAIVELLSVFWANRGTSVPYPNNSTSLGYVIPLLSCSFH